MKSQFQSRSAALSENIQRWKAESEAAQASCSVRQRRSPRLDLGVRTATLRSMQHRQTEQGRRALFELEAELFQARQTLESETSSSGPSEESLVSRLRQARTQLEVVEDTHARIRRREVEQ